MVFDSDEIDNEKCLNCEKILEGRDKKKFCSRSCAASYNNKIYIKKEKTKYFCKKCGNEIGLRRSLCDSCRTTKLPSLKVFGKIKFCRKCKKEIPKKILINEESITVSGSRKLCFECSPFDKYREYAIQRRICPKCGGEKSRFSTVCKNCNKNNEKTFEDAKGLLTKKLRLIEERSHRCEICGNTEWLGKPIQLELHHKDGNSDNNVRENLQLLCPNCHSTTDNYRAKNIGNGSKRSSYRKKYYENK